MLVSDLQPLFRRFHEAILLTWENEGARLRQRRDEVLKVLRDRLAAERRLTFTQFNQGSYEMGTGIKPQPGGAYDIDVGVVFALEPQRYQSQEVRQWIFDGLRGWNPEWRQQCITIRGDRFHMDLPVLIKDPAGQHYLGIGKLHAADRAWRPDEQHLFVKRVTGHLTEGPTGTEDNHQFRRVVRYLKRWKDVHFSPEATQRRPASR